MTPCAKRFRALGDLERILTRVALRCARPRDLSTLRDGLGAAARRARRARAAGLAAPAGARRRTRRTRGACARCSPRAIVPQPPVLARDGGVIADGYDAELDELRAPVDERGPVPRRPGSARTRRHRHRDAEGRLQPRARLLHRNQQGPGRQGADALHAPPDADRRRALHHRGTQGIRGQGAVGARAFAGAREAAVRGPARRARTQRPRTAQALRGRAVANSTCWPASPSARRRWTGRARTARRARHAHRARPPSGGRSGAQRAVRAERPGARRRPAHAA